VVKGIRVEVRGRGRANAVDSELGIDLLLSMKRAH